MNPFLDDPPAGDPLVAALRSALEAEAAAVTPSPTGLQRIQSRIEADQVGQRRAGRARAMAVTAGLAAAVVGLVALVADPPGARAPQPAGPAATAPALPVYYPGQVGTGYRLFREFHPMTAGTAADGAVAAQDRAQLAVDQALSRRPDDPDYAQLWPAGSRAVVALRAGSITVVLNAAAFGAAAANGSDTSKDAVLLDQLVWTATAAAVTPAGPGPTQVLISGLGGARRFGPVDLTGPLTRATPSMGSDPRAAVWIDSLGQGAVLRAGRVTVTGEGTLGARIGWRLTRDGTQVEAGSVTAAPPASGGRWQWSLPLDLTPGSYRLTATTSDGADSKDFTVRA